jgi:mono/diheme cytochrome c family protein
MIRLATKTTLLTSVLTLVSWMAMAAAANAQDAKRGQEVYNAQKCSICHSIAGKGGKASPLDGVATKLSAADIREWITHPVDAAAKHKSTKKPLMPNKYGSLPAADIDALVAYMQTLK